MISVQLSLCLELASLGEENQKLIAQEHFIPRIEGRREPCGDQFLADSPS